MTMQKMPLHTMIEYKGVKYSCGEITRENDIEQHPDQWIGMLSDNPQFVAGFNEILGCRATLHHVYWNSEEGFTKPHDVEIVGEYKIIMPKPETL